MFHHHHKEEKTLWLVFVSQDMVSLCIHPLAVLGSNSEIYLNENKVLTLQFDQVLVLPTWPISMCIA